MSLQRRYSKAKANGNRVVFDNQTIIPVVFSRAGVVEDGLEIGYFRVGGWPMFMTDYRIDFRVPAADRVVIASATIYTGENTMLNATTVQLNGVVGHAEKNLVPAVAMPVGSTWKLKLAISGSSSAYWPKDMTLTYFLRYANGPVSQTNRSGRFTTDGVGFDFVGEAPVQ